MHFRKRVKGQASGIRIFLICMMFAVSCQTSALSYAGLIDGVAAFVNDKAVTISELNEAYEKTKKIKRDILKTEVLNTMINRLLLLTEAGKMKITGQSDEEVINEYIELKVKAFIVIREEEIEDFYMKNEAEFRGLEYEAVSSKIEAYLTEQNINTVLKKHIEELRAKAYVKITAEGL